MANGSNWRPGKVRRTAELKKKTKEKKSKTATKRKKKKQRPKVAKMPQSWSTGEPPFKAEPSESHFELKGKREKREREREKKQNEKTKEKREEGSGVAGGCRMPHRILQPISPNGSRMAMKANWPALRPIKIQRLEPTTATTKSKKSKSKKGT